jgi:CubicO group peptidase (beta-lactamase class C family)
MFMRLALLPRLKSCLLLAAACAAPALANAQPAALPPEFNDWDAFMARQLELWRVPGASIALVKDGRIILTKGYGLRDVQRKLPMTEHTVQPIASVTKSFTVAALATLVREGRIAWDRPVREVLPDFRMHSDYATQTLTVRDLLTHRSGLPRHDFAWFGSPHSREQLYARLRHFELSAEPRSRFQYNNLMYMTAGYLGGRVAGSDWESLVRKNLFEPLAMASSSFTIADLERQADHGSGYAVDDEDESIKPAPYQDLVAMGPTGSINSNARDMANYLLMFAQGGRFKDQVLINPGDLREMGTGLIPFADAPPWPELVNLLYGMGLQTAIYRGVAMAGHGGNMPGASTIFAFVPSRGVGVYATVNVSGSALRDVIMYAAIDRLLGLPPVDWSARLRKQYEDGVAARKSAVRQNLAPRRAGTKPGLALDEYVGEYEHPGYGTVEIGRDGDTLTVAYNGFRSALPHLHLDVFQAPRHVTSPLSQSRVMFVPNFEGEITALRTEWEPNVKPIEFARLPDKALRDPKLLAAFEGTYAIGLSEWTVRLRPDGVLAMATRTGAPVELVGLRGRRFQVKGQAGFQVEFVPDAANPAGRITQMALHRSGSSVVAQRK